MSAGTAFGSLQTSPTPVWVGCVKFVFQPACCIHYLLLVLALLSSEVFYLKCLSYTYRSGLKGCNYRHDYTI